MNKAILVFQPDIEMFHYYSHLDPENILYTKEGYSELIKNLNDEVSLGMHDGFVHIYNDVAKGKDGTHFEKVISVI